MELLTLITLPLVKIIIGGLIGLGMLVLDQQWLYRFYSDDLAGTKTNTYLITRSIIFMLLYVPLLLYVLTSSGSLVGMGVMLGLGWGLSLELLRLRSHREQFHHRFLWQIKRLFTPEEIKWIVRMFVGLVAVSSLLCLRFFI